MTQCELIIRHINDYGSITSLEAMQEYGIMRLASRINDLKKAGYKVKSQIVHSVNRYGDKIHFSKYFIE